MQEDIEAEREWKNIRKTIDREYQKKLKQVNDEAMMKLQDYEREHNSLIEKSQYLFSENKRSKSRGSVVSRGSRTDSANSGGDYSFISTLKRGSHNRNRNRFFTPKLVDDMGPPEVAIPQDDWEVIKIKQFYKEYCAVVQKNVNKDNQIYLIDVLEQLHFLDDESVNDYRMEFCQLLEENKKNLMVYSKSGLYSGESEDIIKNLFKICCGIQNFKLKQRGHNPLDDKLLKSYVGAINFNHKNPNFILMDQVNTIKALINRKAYFLTHSQIEFLYEKFQNLNRQRREFKEVEERMLASKLYEQQSLRKTVAYIPQT